MIIAVDGPAASGKGTLSRRIAEHFGFVYLDTGLLYRAVARDVMATDGAPGCVDDAVAAARSLDPDSLDDPGLRRPGVGEAASIVAGIPQVRATLLAFQRSFAATPPGAVLDGRDIGTVVCPAADVKLFVTADAETRAERRYREMNARGEPVELEDVRDEIHRRDRRDTDRADAPMRQAGDAVLLDTSKLSIEAAFDAALELIKRKIGQPGA